MVNQISFVKYLDLGCHSCQLPHRHLTEIQRDVEWMGISRRSSEIFRGQGLPFAYLGKGWATYRWSKTTNNFWECRQGLQEGSMMNSMQVSIPHGSLEGISCLLKWLRTCIAQLPLVFAVGHWHKEARGAKRCQKRGKQNWWGRKNSKKDQAR